MSRSRRHRKKKSKPLTWQEVMDAIDKLISADLVNIDFAKPAVFLSLKAYKVFCCDESGIFVDEKKALGFLSNVRFFINFRRAYLSGIRQGIIEDALSMGDVNIESKSDDSADKWQYPPVSGDTSIGIYVASSDDRSILLYGSYDEAGLTLRAYKKEEEKEE